MFSKKETGSFGEKLAFGFLKRNSFTIRELNFSSKFGEIDVIAEKEKILYFIEVKTRKNERFGNPLEAVDEKKKKKIQKCALYYLLKKNLSDSECRFGIIAIQLIGEAINIEWIENAFDIS